MATTFVKIASVTVGAGGAANIEFTSIPQTYTDLVINFSGRSVKSASFEDVKIQFNSSTTNYSDRYLLGNGSTASSGSGASTGIYNLIVPAANATTSTFSNNFVYIPNYAGSNNKSVSIDVVTENNATLSYLNLVAGLWSNTAAITSIKIVPDTANNFAQYSTAVLYGIKSS